MSIATKEQKVKSILDIYRNRDPVFGYRYVADPYLGCSQQCTYCANPIELETQTVQVRLNAAEVLSRQLVKKSRETVGIGYKCDPYMPLEKHYLITHDLLQVLAVQGFPVHIKTRSTLVLRDKKILQEIASKTMASVTFEFCSPFISLAKQLEPNVPSPIKRFNALHNLASKGVTCGVALNPILPFIGDDQKGIKQIIIAAKESGASYILKAPLSIANKHERAFLAFLETNYRELVQPYRFLYGREGIVPDSYWQPINEMIETLAREQGMRCEAPYWTEVQSKQLSLF